MLSLCGQSSHSRFPQILSHFCMHFISFGWTLVYFLRASFGCICIFPAGGKNTDAASPSGEIEHMAMDAGLAWADVKQMVVNAARMAFCRLAYNTINNPCCHLHLSATKRSLKGEWRLQLMKCLIDSIYIPDIDKSLNLMFAQRPERYL